MSAEGAVMFGTFAQAIEILAIILVLMGGTQRIVDAIRELKRDGK